MSVFCCPFVNFMLLYEYSVPFHSFSFTMYKAYHDKNWIIGLWKFNDRVPKEELCDLASKWADDQNYIQLYVRKVSKDQNGIGFTYQYETVGGPDNAENQKKAFDEYIEKNKDILLKKFGISLVGWDIASSAISIK